MHQRADGADRNAPRFQQPRDAFQDRLGRVLGGGQLLVDGSPAGLVVDQREIRERPSNIASQSILRHRRPLLPTQRALEIS